MRQLSLDMSKSLSGEVNRRTSSKPMLLVEPKQTAGNDFPVNRVSYQVAGGSTQSSRPIGHYVIDDNKFPESYHEQFSSEDRTEFQIEKSNSKDKDKEASKRHKKMRNSTDKLTSMLVILFGLILLAKIVSCGLGDGSTNLTVTGETTNAKPAANYTGEPTTMSPIAGEESSLEEDEPSPDANSKGDTDTRLSSLIVDTTSEAVENILVERSQTLPESDETDNEDTNHLTTDAGDARESSALVDELEPEQTNSTTKTRDELEKAMKVYRRWRSSADDFIELFSRKILPIIMQNGYDLDAVSMTNLLQIFNAIRGIKPWALKLLDASAKLTPGLLVGTQSDFGDFDECLNVRADNPSGLNEDDVGRTEIDPLTGLKSTTIVGKYCIADVEFPKPPRVRLEKRNQELNTDFAPVELRRPLLNFSETADFKDTIFVETANFFHMLYVDPIRVGICLTNKIDPDGFANIINKLVKDFSVTIDFKGRCVTKYDKPIWTNQQLVSAYVLLVSCSLVLLSTLLDLLHMKLNKLPLPGSFDAWKLDFRASMLRYQPLFTSFSIIRNTKRLFKQQQQERSSPGNQTNSVISPGLAKSMALCSTSTSTDCVSQHNESSPSLESSPSIERRSSLASSAVDLISEQSSKPAKQLATCFVFPGVKEKLGRRENNLQCLHGIRVITMTWMIVNHTYLFGGFFVLWAHRRLIDIAEWPKSLSFQLVLNGWLTVETYFFLSAAIIVLNVMPLMRSNKFIYLSYIVHRLIRLLPAYIGLVCLNFLWPLISSGPVWLVKGRSFIQTPCENYLWTNFLFINNWIWPEKQCMVHTWFLSADFQLYLIAPIIVYLLYRRPVLGHSLNVIVAILASILSGFVIYANKLMPTTLINKLEFDSIKQQLSYSYFATYQHMGPYCLGIFIGYLLYKRPQVHLPRHLTWCLWLLLPPLSFTTLLLTYLWNGAYNEPNLINPSPIVSAFYVAIHRTIWTSLLAWIVFACATGRAKLMSSFLSNPIFVPLSRLSFSIYLVHLPVIMFRALNLRHTIEWTDSNILWEACGNFVVSLVFGYFLNIFFESPIINLERVIFGRSANGSGEFKDSTRCQDKYSLKDDSPDEPASLAAKSGDSSSSENDQSSPREVRKLPLSKWTKRTEMDLHAFSDTSAHRVDLVRKIAEQEQQPHQGVIDDRFGPTGANLEHQMGSLATTGTSLESAQTDIQQVGQTVSRQRLKRFSTMVANDDNPLAIFSDDNDLYPASGVLPGGPRFKHYPDRPYSALVNQHSGYLQSSPQRPQQYATLARTSRPSEDEWPLNSVSQSLDDYRSYLIGRGVKKSYSQLGEPTMAHRAPDMTKRNLSRHGLAYSSQRQRYSGHRCDGARYNTLTLTGAGGGPLMPTSNWLQPGSLLPRIDSSTLRRQQKSPDQKASTSIAEEPNSLSDDLELP